MPPQKRSRNSVVPLRKRARVEDYDTAFQPTSGNTTQQLPQRPSPRKCLTIAASLAIEPSTFESQMRESQPEDAIAAPLEGSNAATETIEATKANNNEAFNERLGDNFEGIH